MRNNSLYSTLVMLFGGSALVAASAGFSVAQAQTPNTVVIKNFMFSPMELTVKAGSTVTWKNLDGEPHTVVNDAGMFRSAALDQNDTYQFKFDKPGVYKVFCGIHPNMKETITVQ
ncbi:cupredoxin domain-containing protein [Paraburkholderia fungorum]|uniref:Plastocyanin n=2 Tax=Paraburkholderia fungorum TaxID=134537 RepID=A0AAW3V5I1_9BURK|nr:cupredoxin family copper-binding protein [Paraburkholderia fungorum]MBB4519257.1 plastocyanin [Paraburkholderia fungorum]MBB6206222.1 plastocyanin [Paraburkholderia fungorum]